MKFIIIDNVSKYLTELINLFSDYEYEVIPYGEIVKKRINVDDFIILSGGHSQPVLWHHEEYLKEFQLLDSHKGPIVGICLGFQLIAHHYGSRLHLLEERRKGLLEIRPKVDSQLIDEKKLVNVYENHRWCAQTIKSPLVALAVSDDGVEIFKHTSKPIYGFQFHPESSEGDGKEILQKVISDLILEYRSSLNSS